MPQNHPLTRLLPPLLLAALTVLPGHTLAAAPQAPAAPPPEQSLLAEPPANIALLLPVSGPLAKPAAAVRDGFFAAHYHRLNKLYQPIIRLYDTGAQPASIVEVYRQAVADGADVVVGPLDKESVKALAREGSIGVPTLALNYGDDEGALAGNLFQFGLSPEDEANAVAERAAQDGLTQAAALIPKSDWGERMLRAFRTRFEQLGGRVVAAQSYDAEGTDFATPLRNLLADGDTRTRKNQGNARYRQDVDFLFMAAYPRQARQIQPQMSFNYANLPVYATSHVYTGRPDKGADSDEDGIVFCDMPWVFDGGAQPLQQAIARLWPQSVDQFRRLYALGVDAYALTPALNRKLSGLTEPFAGQTGLLQMDAARRIRRSLTCARFVAGEPRVLAPGHELALTTGNGKPPVRGAEAEELACRHLQQQGLYLVERNYRCQRGEIDLIMRDGASMVFVEVRYRRSTRFGSGAESIDRRKQAKLAAAALHYLQSHRDAAKYPARFDVVSIAPDVSGNRIDWIKNAFEA